MSSHQKFADRVLAGEVHDLNTIHDEIIAWHEGAGDECELHEWLGLTEDEYALFVEQPKALRQIFFARQYGTSIADFLTSNKTVALAARGASTEEVQSLVAWLKKTGRI